MVQYKRSRQNAAQNIALGTRKIACISPHHTFSPESGCTATAPVSVPVFFLPLPTEVRSRSLLLALAVTYSSTAWKQGNCRIEIVTCDSRGNVSRPINQTRHPLGFVKHAIRLSSKDSHPWAFPRPIWEWEHLCCCSENLRDIEAEVRAPRHVTPYQTRSGQTILHQAVYCCTPYNLIPLHQRRH